jgi:PAS domain S-box-containing protein
MNLVKLFTLNHLRLDRILICAYVILATMTVALTSWYLLSERNLLLRGAELQIGSLTRALEEHALRTFSAVDGQLRQASRRILDRGALEAQNSASIRPLLQETVASLRFVRAVYVDDRFGRGHTTSQATNIRSWRARDFEYLRPLYDNTADDKLSIGLPSKGSVSGRGNLPVARRMIDASGRFAGVIGTAILPEYFQDFYNSLGLPADARLALLRPDGEFLIYHPERGQAQAKLSDSSVFRERISKEPSGMVQVQSVIDGTDRLISFWRIGEMNLIVTISRDRSVILAPWNRLVLSVGSTVGGSLAVLFLLLWLALRQIKYRAEAEDRFKAFMNRSPAIAFIKDENGRYVYVNQTWERLYALDWRGKTDSEIWPRDNVEMFKESDLRALGAGEASESFETVSDKDGRPQDWWVIKFPIADAEGKRLLGGMAMDITEQKRRQAELEEAHIALTNAMPGIARLGTDGRYITVNQMYASMLGFEPQELIGTDWSGTVHADDRAAALAAYERMLEVGKGEFEARAIRKDGSIFYKQVLMVKIFDDSGLHAGHHCFMRDISERKQAERSLRLTQFGMDRAVDGMFWVLPSAEIIYVNDAACRLLGYAREELVGKTVPDIDLNFPAEAWPAHWEDLRQKGSFTFESDHRTKDGRLLKTEVTVNYLMYEGEEYNCAIMRDITERKEAEDTRGRLAAIVESSGDAIVSRSLDFKVLTWNSAAERMFGYSADEAIGRSTDFITPADRRAEVDEKRAIVAQGHRVQPYDTVRLARNGRRVDVSIMQSPITNSSGRMIAVSLTIRDISERKRAEEALRAAHDQLELRVAQRTAELTKSNALLREKDQHLTLAQRAGHAGLWSRDLTAGTSSMSPEWHELIGFPVDETPVSFAEFLGRVHPDDRERVEDLSLHQKIGDFDREFRIIHPIKGERWILSRGRRGVSAEDGHLHMMGALIDITERKQTEEALRWSEERLQHALRVGSMGLWERDLRTGKEQWDRRTYEIFGIEAQTSVDLEMLFSRIHPNDLPVVKSALERTQSTGVVYVCEYRVLKPDGKTIWIHANGGLRRDRDGTPTHVAGINFDITERKQAEDALRDSEARLRAILDHNPAPVFIKDTAGRYVHVNSRFEELFGLHGIDSVGKTDAELFASEQAEAFQTNDRKVLDLGHAIQFEEVAQYHDGEHTSIVTKFPLRDGQGKIYALCGIATDITERKAAEDELRKLNQELDQRVARRTQELAESHAKLRALVAELTRAEERERRRLAVELHDYLAQSLTATRMNLSRADKFIAGANGNSDLKKILHDVHGDLNNSINYTRTLIAELSPRVLYDLGLPAALGWLGEQMGRHGLRVEVDGPRDGLSLAEDDAVFLFQCGRELLWNVVKHGETDQATVAFGRDGDRVSLAVVDNGKGFDPRTAHANGDGGSHYGLFSIRERVEPRGGCVEIDSTPGVGTWVTIILPVDASEEVSNMMVEQKPSVRVLGESVRIVIVDDHKMVRQGLRRVLEEHDDFSIVGEAGDGAEAVAMARELEPHVVIMDVNLPTMSGIDATRDIVRERPSTIVIGLSFGSDSYVSQAMQAAGAVTCIAKERAVEDVRQAIMDAVEGRRVGTAR